MLGRGQLYTQKTSRKLRIIYRISGKNAFIRKVTVTIHGASKILLTLYAETMCAEAGHIEIRII
jgi:hypothetical protein